MARPLFRRYKRLKSFHDQGQRRGLNSVKGKLLDFQADERGTVRRGKCVSAQILEEILLG